MNAAKWAYVAGLFEGEGEGWVGVAGMGRGKYRYFYARIRIDMTDREPLELVQGIAGSGWLSEPYKRGAALKPIQSLTIQGWEPVEAFYRGVRPWLSPRRRDQFERALAQKPSADRLGHGSHERRKTHCPQGHPYDAANTSVNARGWRTCRACARERERRKHGYYERRGIMPPA